MAAYGKFAKGLLWLVNGRLASAVLSFASTAVLARLLTPSDFGMFAAAVVVLALANVLFDGAFGVNLVRKPNLREEDVRTTLTVALCLAVLLTAAVCLIAPATERFFGFSGLALIQCAASATIPLKAMLAIASAQLQREGRFKAIATASLLGQLFGYIIVAVPLSMIGAGIWALVAAMIVSGLVETAISGMLVRLPFRPAWDAQTIRDIKHSSLFTVSHMLNWAANTGANAIVGRVMGAADLGLYSRSWKLLDLIVAATATPLSKLLLPAFAKLHGQSEQLRDAFLRTLGLVLPAYAILSVLLALQAPLIVELALGKQWHDTIPVVQILFATLVPRCAFKVSENFAMAIGKASAAAARQCLYALMMVSGALLGVRHGLSGVAAAVSIAIAIFYVVSMSYAARVGNIGVSPIVNLHLRAALLAGSVALSDLVVLNIFASSSIFEKHIFAGTIAAVIGGLLILGVPGFWLGKANGRCVRKMSHFVFLEKPFGHLFSSRS